MLLLYRKAIISSSDEFFTHPKSSKYFMQDWPLVNGLMAIGSLGQNFSPLQVECFSLNFCGHFRWIPSIRGPGGEPTMQVLTTAIATRGTNAGNGKAPQVLNGNTCRNTKSVSPRKSNGMGWGNTSSRPVG